MKIKIKVKTILLLILTFIFVYLTIIPFAYLEIAGHLDRKGSDKAVIFYDSFLSKSIIWNRSKALYEYASGLIGDESKFQLMIGGWGGGNNKTVEDLEKGAEALEEILSKGSRSKKDIKYSLLAYPKILNTYIQLQSPEDLLHWINWGKDSTNEKISYISDIYQSYYHIVNREYDLAENIVNKYNEDMEIIDYRYYFTKGEIALWQGNSKLSEELYHIGSIEMDNYIENQAYLFSSLIYQRRQHWFNDYYNLIKGDSKIKGKVTYNGQPMPFVEIYLYKKEVDISFRSLSGDLVGITDINGEYETLGFDAGIYDIGLGISPAILQDKVYQRPDYAFIDIGKTQEYDFAFTSPFNILSPKEDILAKNDRFELEWEDVPGADYYQIQVSSPMDPLDKSLGHISYFIEDENSNDKIKGSSAQFDINKLNILTSRFVSSDGARKVLPSAILGQFQPQNDYYLSVSAYDKNSKLLNSTVGLQAYYEDYKKLIIEKDFSKGEKLIIDRKYKEAIDYYEDILDNDSNNMEALLNLSQLHHIGLMPEVKNYGKALEYSQRYDKENNNNLLTYHIIMDMSNETIRKYKDLVKNTLDGVMKESTDANIHYYLAKYHLSLKEYDLAREDLTKTDYYSRNQIIYIDLYNGDIQNILEALNSDELDFYSIDKKSFADSLRKIGSKTIESKDYKILKDILEKILSEDIENRKIYNESIGKIQDSNLNYLFNQIAIEEGWLLQY